MGTWETGKPLGTACSLAVLPDHRFLAALEEGRFFTWNLQTGKMHLLIESSSTICAFSPDGALLARGNSFEGVLLFDSFTGDERCRMATDGATNCLAFAPDGKTLACGSGASISLWDVITGERKPSIAEPLRLRQLCFTGRRS